MVPLQLQQSHLSFQYFFFLFDVLLNFFVIQSQVLTFVHSDHTFGINLQLYLRIHRSICGQCRDPFFATLFIFPNFYAFIQCGFEFTLGFAFSFLGVIVGKIGQINFFLFSFFLVLLFMNFEQIRLDGIRHEEVSFINELVRLMPSIEAVSINLNFFHPNKYVQSSRRLIINDEGIWKGQKQRVSKNMDAVIRQGWGNLQTLIKIMHIQQQIGLEAERILGKGSFATVYFCTNPRFKDSYAVKVFHKKDFTKVKLNSFRKEAEILSSIEHRNIVKFHSFRETENCLYLIMEYIPGVTLKNLMEERWAVRNFFSDEQTAQIIKCLLQGIQYLQKYNIIHRDLKPGMYFSNYENILVADPSDFATIKIVDFGLSAQLDNNYSKNVKTQCGTLLYMAPQILYQPSYNKSVDLWSVAIIMYLICTGGRHPIYENGMKTEEYKQKLKVCKFPSLENQLAQSFIKRISKIDYTQRYSVNEALKHPWITRNHEDQVPLSVNESIHSFDVSHQIKNICNLCFFVGKQIKKDEWKVPQEYKNKIQQFTILHEDYRSRSPSFKKMGKKTQEVFIKIRQILNHQTNHNEEKSTKFEDQVPSPVLRRHERLYLRLFEKNKMTEFDESYAKKNLFEICKPIPLKECEQREDELKQEKKQESKTIHEEFLSFTNENQSTQKEKIIQCFELNSPKKKIQRKEKMQTKFNLSRIECQSKIDTNLANLRRKFPKKTSLEIKDTSSKRSSRKTLEKEEIELGFSSPKKPQTAGGHKSSSYCNKSRNRPMIFGMSSLYN